MINVKSVIEENLINPLDFENIKNEPLVHTGMSVYIQQIDNKDYCIMTVQFSENFHRCSWLTPTNFRVVMSTIENLLDNSAEASNTDLFPLFREYKRLNNYNTICNVLNGQRWIFIPLTIVRSFMGAFLESGTITHFKSQGINQIGLKIKTDDYNCEVYA